MEQSDQHELAHVMLVSLGVRQVQFRHSSYEPYLKDDLTETQTVDNYFHCSPSKKLNHLKT